MDIVTCTEESGYNNGAFHRPGGIEHWEATCMARVYRCMVSTPEGPRIARDAKSLGVRVPETNVDNSKCDVAVDEYRQVTPGEGGMSVAPAITELPEFRVPRRLRHLVPRAAGNDEMVVWRFGEGEWLDGDFAPALKLRPDSPKHGVVEPECVMTLQKYEAALAATQRFWINAETTE